MGEESNLQYDLFFSKSGGPIAALLARFLTFNFLQLNQQHGQS